MCKVKGCNKPARYKSQNVCQMHYFRMIRNGTYEIIKPKAKYRRTHSSGYQVLKIPDHPIANSRGDVYEHRKVIYDIYGDNLPDCELCGKPCDWKPYTTHIDHINRNKSDNRPENLRVLCNACNSGRDVVMSQREGVFTLTINSETKTAYEWAKTKGAKVNANQIKARFRSGMSAYDSVFGEKLTHKSKKTEQK